jgi:hypothetical protein
LRYEHFPFLFPFLFFQHFAVFCNSHGRTPLQGFFPRIFLVSVPSLERDLLLVVFAFIVPRLPFQRWLVL